MPVTTIPLVGGMTARGFAKTIGTSAKDQQYINCLFEAAINPALGKKALYVVKRPGSTTDSTVGTDVKVLSSQSSYFGGVALSVMSATATAIYRHTTSLGTTGGYPVNLFLSDTVMNQQDVIAFCDTAGSAYYCFKDAVTTNFPTFTGDTHTNTVIDNIPSTTGLYPGQAISGTGIQAATRIATITSSTAITTTLATTATNAGVTITKEAIAKVIDADLPSSVISVVASNGYIFFGFADGRIFNSDINAPNTIGASNYITADYSSDGLSFLAKIGDFIIAFGVNSIQYFQITGNSSGSILSTNRALNRVFISVPTLPTLIGGYLYIVATRAETGYALFRMSSPSELSAVNDDIVGALMGDIGITQLGYAQFSGNKRVVLAHTNSATDIIAYDESTKMFSVFKLGTALNSSFARSFSKNSTNTTFLWATGDTWTDSSSAYTMTIQTEPFVLNDGRPFTISMVELIGDTQASGTTTFTTYNDDYTTALSLTAFDMTAQNKVYQGRAATTPITLSLN